MSDRSVAVVDLLLGLLAIGLATALVVSFVLRSRAIAACIETQSNRSPVCRCLGASAYPAESPMRDLAACRP